MTLIEMAKQALTSLSPDEYSDEPYWSASNEELERFANLIRADEREACAKAAEDFLTSGRSPLGRSVAATIRARKTA